MATTTKKFFKVHVLRKYLEANPKAGFVAAQTYLQGEMDKAGSNRLPLSEAEFYNTRMKMRQEQLHKETVAAAEKTVKETEGEVSVKNMMDMAAFCKEQGGPMEIAKKLKDIDNWVKMFGNLHKFREVFSMYCTLSDNTKALKVLNGGI